MSDVSQFYFGPALIAECQYKQVSVGYRACNNLKCKHVCILQEGNYCNECGNKIATLQREKEVSFPLLEEISNIFLANGLSQHVLTRNISIETQENDAIHFYQPVSFRDESHTVMRSHCFFDISTIDIEKENLRFSETYQKEIAVIATLYKRVEVKYVFVSYQN